jgi:hypothetical protein
MWIKARLLKVGDRVRVRANGEIYIVTRLGFPVYPKMKTYINLQSESYSIKGDKTAAKVGMGIQIEDTELVELL